MIFDGGGIYGNVLHYALTIAYVGSAALLFCFFWFTGRLDMDEEPKKQMMEEKENE